MTPKQLDRRTYIGSSDAAAILGVSPWQTAYQVWQRKTSPVVLAEEESKVMKRGKRLEPVVLEMLSDDHPEIRVIARNSRFTDAAFPYLSAEIDAEATIDGFDDVVNIEVKTVHPSKSRQWGEEETDEIPLWYAAQISHALMVTDRKLCIVAALIGADDLRVYRVERDDQLIDSVRRREVEFWTNHVLTMIPPPPSSLADINAMYQRDDGGSCVATDGIVEAVANLAALKRTAKELESRMEEEERAIKSAMGDRSILVDAGGKKLATWLVVEREVFDQRAFTEQNPELAKEFRKRIASRTFRVA
jgi:putative phage-type endonuclease